MASSTGRGLGPGTPDSEELEGSISGMLPAFSCNSHQERRAEVTFPISQLGALRPDRS